METKTLYKYSISLDMLKNEAVYELREHKIKIDSETEKLIQFFDGRSRKLKKDKLGVIDTIFHEKVYDFINYFVYCWESEIEASKQALVDAVHKGIEKRVETIHKLIAAFEKGYEFKEMKQYFED